MQPRNTPAINARYWTKIALASVFGANLGDFVAHNLHMGHARGLIPLGLILIGVLLLERRSKRATDLYYWAAIVIIRTAATNLADLGTHDLKLGYGLLIMILTALLTCVVTLDRGKTAGGRQNELPLVNPMYWIAMLIAGTLGTAAGDAVSGALGLGVEVASAVLAIMLAAIFALRTMAAFRNQAFYWITIVAIRTTGTTVGDLSADTLGLSSSTMLTGYLFVAAVLLWHRRQQEGLRV